ncbi:signal recognition particle-docking protein FtsY, partial [Nitrosopumilus sp. b1]
PKPKPEPKPELDSDDPFDGIDTKDINKYADMYDEPPPESDAQAKELASKIRKWIEDGRPKPGEEPKKQDDADKSKKKRSLFGRFKK